MTLDIKHPNFACILIYNKMSRNSVKYFSSGVFNRFVRHTVSEPVRKSGQITLILRIFVRVSKNLLFTKILILSILKIV